MVAQVGIEPLRPISQAGTATLPGYSYRAESASNLLPVGRPALDTLYGPVAGQNKIPAHAICWPGLTIATN